MKARKKYLVAGLLTLFTLWPFVHLGIVYVYEMNPWKLFGFAMYCVPSPLEVKIVLYDRSNGPRVSLAMPPAYEYDLDARQEYITKSFQTGSLFKPDLLAEQVFKAYPHVTFLEVIVVHHPFDLGQRRVVVRKRGYRYVRGDESLASI